MLILDFGDQFVFGGRFVFWQKKCGEAEQGQAQVKLELELA